MRGLQDILERFRNTGHTDCSGLQGIYVLMHKADMGDLIRLIPKQACCKGLEFGVLLWSWAFGVPGVVSEDSNGLYRCFFREGVFWPTINQTV